MRKAGDVVPVLADIKERLDKIDNITKDTTYLIVPDELTSSSKVTKANKYAIKILSLDAFRKELSKM